VLDNQLKKALSEIEGLKTKLELRDAEDEKHSIRDK
jgi:hypothetical protein